MEIFKIDSTICDYYSDTKEDEEGANIIVGWCHDNGCECSEVPFDECLVKAIQYCKLKDKQLKRKKQECEELNKELHKNFKEKDTLHLIIDRLLEASGYDTNTATAEDFEDVYEHMRYEQQQLDQLKSENKHLNDLLNQALKELEKTRETLTEIKEIAEDAKTKVFVDMEEFWKQILQKISECEGNDEM